MFRDSWPKSHPLEPRTPVYHITWVPPPPPGNYKMRWILVPWLLHEFWGLKSSLWIILFCSGLKINTYMYICKSVPYHSTMQRFQTECRFVYLKLLLTGILHCTSKCIRIRYLCCCYISHDHCWDQVVTMSRKCLDRKQKLFRWRKSNVLLIEWNDYNVEYDANTPPPPFICSSRCKNLFRMKLCHIAVN